MDVKQLLKSILRLLYAIVSPLRRECGNIKVKKIRLCTERIPFIPLLDKISFFFLGNKNSVVFVPQVTICNSNISF